jgi:hypothetical protein
MDFCIIKSMYYERKIKRYMGRSREGSKVCRAGLTTDRKAWKAEAAAQNA